MKESRLGSKKKARGGVRLSASILALATLALLPAAKAQAAVAYDAMLEWTGPYFRVIHGPLADQLVDSPLHDIAFSGPCAVAAREHGTGQRDVVYVADSGHNRIQVFEANATYAYASQSDFTYRAAGVNAASQWCPDQINLAQWALSPTQFVTPYSETVAIDGAAWRRVADLTPFTAADKVYRIDYTAAASAPAILFPSGSLSSTSTFALRYAISDPHTGAVPSCGIGDVDYGIGQGASPTLIQIDESSGGPTSWQQIQSIALVADEETNTSDDLFLIDAADNSAGQNEELFEYKMAVAGSLSYVGAYDDVLTGPYDVAVARAAASSAAAVAISDDGGPFDQGTAAVIDANQVTGHSYAVSVLVNDVTITDATTGRILVNSAAFTDLANPFRGIPGLSLPLNGAVGANITITTTRAVSRRYLFVADTGADRIKVIAAGSGAATSWPGTWLAGDAHTVIAQPTGAGTVGATANQDYRYTTPGTVPKDYSVYTNAYPLKEGTLAGITIDPDGTPVAWTRVDNLSSAGPLDKVYQIDWQTGLVLFGNGTHGLVPPASTAFQFNYTTTPDLIRLGSSGSTAGAFSGPKGIAARWNSSLGAYDVYVADSGNDRIQKFDFYPAALNLPARLDYVCQWNKATSAADSLDNPVDVAVAVDNQTLGAAQTCYVAVADRGHSRIVIYRDSAATSGGGTAAPVFDSVLGAAGSELGGFSQVSGLCFLQNGNDLDLYAADSGRNTVTKYKEAPTPAVSLSFQGASALPRCLPRTSSYPFHFTVSNAPAGGWIDLYYDTASTFNISTSLLCITSHTILTTATEANWVFASSPGGLPADQSSYYLFAELKDAAGVIVASDQTAADSLLCLDSSLIPTLLATDQIDGDRTLYLQNSLPRVINLQIAYPESVIAAKFTGAFDTTLVEIKGITAGDAWNGLGATNQVFQESHDNTAGTYQVNCSVTGAPVGLVASGPHTIAQILVQAKPNAISAAHPYRNGTLTVVKASSDINTTHGTSPASWTSKSLNLRMAYLGDLATTSSGADSSAPHLAPKPDGKIDFADQMIFTVGWNGANHVQDEISDLGPASGEAPNLITAPDGRWDLDDILAFTTMYSWAAAEGSLNSRSAMRPTKADCAASRRSLPTGDLPFLARPQPLALGPEVAGEGRALTVGHLDSLCTPAVLICELWVEGVRDLAGALLDLSFDATQLELVKIEDGGFLRGADGGLFFPRTGPGWAEMAISRLDRGGHGIDGRGPVARLQFKILAPCSSPLMLNYDLRGSGGSVLARGQSRQSAYEGAPAAELNIVACPNPAIGRADLILSLVTASQVRLELFDPAGRRVRSLVDAVLPPGIHRASFDGRDDLGRTLPCGVYFYSLRAGRSVVTRKLVLTR